MTTRQKILSVLFFAGAVIGFGSELAHLREHARHRRADFHQQMARTCAEAARAAQAPADDQHGGDNGSGSTGDSSGSAGDSSSSSSGSGDSSSEVTLTRAP